MNRKHASRTISAAGADLPASRQRSVERRRRQREWQLPGYPSVFIVSATALLRHGHEGRARSNGRRKRSTQAARGHQSSTERTAPTEATRETTVHAAGECCSSRWHFMRCSRHRLQCVTNNSELLNESDWRHLSNIVSAYETFCLQSYLQQRSAAFLNEPLYHNEHSRLQQHVTLPMNLTSSLFAFLGSLPVTRSLSHMNQTYLSKHNLRPLLFPNMLELNQLCFREPWQVKSHQANPSDPSASLVLDRHGAIHLEMDLWTGTLRANDVHD